MPIMQSITVALTLLLLGEITSAAPTPVQVVYTGDEGCACPTKLGYQLNVPNPSKPKKYEGGDYGYRVEKPVQTKAKISYSFDFTVEQPRTPVPPKNKPSKLYAKVDRVAVHKSDCRAAQKSSCSCSSCSSAGTAADKPRYVAQSTHSSANANAIRRRRDLSSHGSLLRKRIMRQQQLQSRPARYVKYYHKDLDAAAQQQHKMRLFGLLQAPDTSSKRKTKKAPALSSKHSKRWPGFGRRKRDIKGEFDLLERERAKLDLTAPEIIQYMPETLNPNFKRGQCHTGCGAITASAPPPPETTEDLRMKSNEQQSETAEQPDQTEQPETESEREAEQPSLVNSIPAKRSALSYYPEHQIPSPLSGSYNEYKFVDDSQLRSLLSTTSVPDPLEQSSTPLQFAGDLESLSRRSQYSAPVLAGIGGGYPVEHVADRQLDSIISGIVYQHPDYVNPQEHYGGSLVDPEPVQKKQTTDFLKKLIDGRLGGWGFDTSTEPESAVRADYSTTPSKTYGFNTLSQNGYNVESYNVPPISDYLRAWF
ncbi:hypothetical protein KR093_006896 [Drosophila rubida]|uniref:Uncharacterized protein n=1 Tax=Drosophila rubida TaxID=30044 RepID=A0AAD4KBD3_9MUSC|nr:hypothetical protein KR093_006896 [Drosophila rubida]